MNLDSLRSAADLSATNPHGTRLKYMGGCKCMLCRAANSRYETERAVARKNGDWNGIVDARAARRHILKLSKAGVGYKSVADAASVAHTVVAEIRAGRRLRIRQRTERSILAVTKTAYAGVALIDADPTWKKINTLLDEGFTKSELARTSWVENTSPSVRPLRGDSEDGRTRQQVLPGDHAWRRCAPEEGGMSNTHHTDIP